MTTSLSSDLILDDKKYRVARREDGSLAYRSSTRSIETGEGDWEIVIDDWSGGMGLAELPTGRQYTNRFYYSQDFDTTIPRILRPRQPIGDVSVSTDTPGPILSSFEDRQGTTDYVYHHYMNTASGGFITAAKIALNSATPTLIETSATSNTSDRAGQPVKAYSSAASAERWFVPLQNGDRIRRLGTIVAAPTVGASQNERWNLLTSSAGNVALGSDETGSATTTMSWTLGTSDDWATVGISCNGSGSIPPTLIGLHSTSGTGSSLTIPDVIVAGLTRAILVAVSIANGSSQTVSTVTFDGTSLTAVSSGSVANGTSARVEWFELIAPDNTVGDVVVTLSGSATFGFGVVNLVGANQSTLVTDTSTATGTSTAVTVDVTSGSTELVLDCVAAAGQAVADSWAIITSITDGARHFVRVGDTIWRTHTTSSIDSFAIGPTTAFETDANWAGINQAVGESELNISGLTALGRLLHIAKAGVDGLYGGDKDANLIEMLPELHRNDFTLVRTGIGTRIWHSKIYYPAAEQGAWRHTGAAAIDVGPDSMPENYGDVPNLSNQIRHGAHAGLESSSKWLYWLYPLSTSYGYLLVARDTTREDQTPHELVWHPLIAGAFTTFDERDPVPIKITWNGANPRLWFTGTGVNLSYIDLAGDGSPYRPNSDRGTSLTSQMWQSEYDMGTPGTLKYIREGELIIENGDSNAAWTMHYYNDGGSEVALGTSMTASGSTTKFVTAGSNDTFRRIRPSIKCVISSGLTDERVHAKRLILRGGYLPEKALIYEYTLDVSEGWQDSQEVIHDDPVDATITTLQGDRTGSVKTLIDHREQSRTVIVEEVNEVDGATVGLDPTRSYVQVVMREVSYA